METFLYTVIPALYQSEGGPEAQVGDQVKLYLDTDAQPGFPEFITGIIQHPIVRVCDGTQYDIEYDPADLEGAAELLVTGDVVSALVVSAVDLLRDYLETEVARATAAETALDDRIDDIPTVEELDVRYRAPLILETSPVDSTRATGRLDTPMSTFDALSNGETITIGSVVYTKGAAFNESTKTFTDAADLASLLDSHPLVSSAGYTDLQIYIRCRLVGESGNDISITTTAPSVDITSMSGGSDGTPGDYVGQLAISGGPAGFGHICVDVLGIWRQIWSD